MKIETGDKIRIFSEFDSFYNLFKPLTSYGKEYKEKRFFFTKIADLQKDYVLTDAAAAFFKKSAVSDKLRFHLRNIPNINVGVNVEESAAELFLVRKFLLNTKAIFDIISSKTSNVFNAAWKSDKLLELLNKGGDGDAFYISDSYSSELADKRKEIALADEEIKKLKDGKVQYLNERYGLDFSERDFLIVLEKNLTYFGEQRDLFSEPYDLGRLIVKPIFGNDYLKALSLRDKLRSEESQLESVIIKKLIQVVIQEKDTLREYIETVRKIDIATERARLAKEFKLIKPDIFELNENSGNGSLVKFTNARFIPLELNLKKTDLKYTPFSAEFSKKVNVLYGSNMGGKTVCLKTFLLLQMLTQSGFYVPAQSYKTYMFDNIFFIGGETSQVSGGLSSFGVEMNDFIEAYASMDKGNTLLVMDEFAKTTNSQEGAALLSSILSDLNKKSNVFVFLATHLSGLKIDKFCSWFKMKGFDKTAFNNYFSDKPSCSLREKLKMINRFMLYEMVDGTSENEARDAIKIAGILGVDSNIIDKAEKFMEEK